MEQADLVQEIVRQAIDHAVCLGSGATEPEHDREDAKDGGNRSESPNCPMRGHVLAVQHSEVSPHLFISSHCVGHASAGVDARKRRADQSQEDRKSFDDHEPPAGVGASERPCADELHDVADRSRRCSGRRCRVSAVKVVVPGKILEQVTEAALNDQREDDGLGNVALGVLGFFTHRRDRFKSDEDENRDAGLNDDVAELVRRDDRLGGVVIIECLNTSCGSFVTPPR